MGWVKSNYTVIKKSLSLSILGLVLSLAHIATAFLWLSEESIPLVGASQCWEFFPFCQLSQEVLYPKFFYLVKIYGVLGLLVASCFLFRVAFRLAWWLFLSVFLMKVIFYLSYAGLVENIHNFLLVLDFCFLFLPAKGESG